MLPVVTLTINPAVDVSTHVDRVQAGPKLHCREPRYAPGGGGISVSRVLHRLEVPTVALHTEGGPTGDRLSALLDDEGFATRPVRIEGETRQCFTASESETGTQYRFVLPGPRLQRHEWQAFVDAATVAAEETRCVVASGSLVPGVPDDTYARIAAAARAAGARFVLDSSGPGLTETLAGGRVDLLRCNARAVAELAGEDLAWPDAQAPWAVDLIKRRPVQAVVLTHGADGALLVTLDEQVRFRPPAMEVESTIGAGDSFVAGLCAGLAAEHPLVEACAFGLAVAAATLSTPGTALCRREDVERFYRNIDISCS